MKCPTISALCLLMLALGISADDQTTRRNLISCVNEQLKDDNNVAAPNFRLNPGQMARLQDLIRDEMNKIPLANFNDERQQASIRNIQATAQRSMPSVSMNQLNEILFKLKATTGYCVTYRNYPPQ